jgi:hypothetical protein
MDTSTTFIVLQALIDVFYLLVASTVASVLISYALVGAFGSERVTRWLDRWGF